MLECLLDLSSFRRSNPSSSAVRATGRKGGTWGRRVWMFTRTIGWQILGFMQIASSSQQMTDDVSWAAPPSDHIMNLTETETPPSGDHREAAHRPPFIPILVILVLVLASLCAIMGLVYAYIYFTRITSSQKKKTRKAVKMEPHHYHKEDDKSSNSVGAGGTVPHSTHMFLFKKIHHNNVIK